MGKYLNNLLFSEKFTLVFSLVVYVLFIFVFKLSSQVDLNIIVNLLAILVGFNTASISIIGANPYSKILYKKQVPNQKYTQLDILFMYFKIPTYVSIFTILLIIMRDTFVFNINFGFDNSYIVVGFALISIITNFICIKYLFSFCRKSITEMK